MSEVILFHNGSYHFKCKRNPNIDKIVSNRQESEAIDFNISVSQPLWSPLQTLGLGLGSKPE